MKELKDWTLGEVKEYCSEHDDCTSECLFNVGGLCGLCDVVLPDDWDLGVPPTQTVGVNWHKYPEDKPLPAGDFDRVLIINNGEIKTAIRNAITPLTIKGITAWAELPQYPIWSFWKE